MDPSKYRTSMSDFFLDLLDFMKEKVDEALDGPSGREAALTEAFGVAPIIAERASAENEALFASLILLELTPNELPSPKNLGSLSDADFEVKATNLLEKISAAKACVVALSDAP